MSDEIPRRVRFREEVFLAPDRALLLGIREALVNALCYPDQTDRIKAIVDTLHHYLGPMHQQDYGD